MKDKIRIWITPQEAERIENDLNNIDWDSDEPHSLTAIWRIWLVQPNPLGMYDGHIVMISFNSNLYLGIAEKAFIELRKEISTEQSAIVLAAAKIINEAL